MIVETDTPENELVRILLELQQAEPENESNTLTTSEFVAATGWPRARALAHLNRLADSGVLERCMVARVNGWSERRSVKGFRYVGTSQDAN